MRKRSFDFWGDGFCFSDLAATESPLTEKDGLVGSKVDGFRFGLGFNFASLVESDAFRVRKKQRSAVIGRPKDIGN